VVVKGSLARPASTGSPALAPPATHVWPHIQRKCACGQSGGSSGTCASCREDKLQRRADAAVAEPQHAAVVDASAHTSGGQPLPAPLRARLQPLYGHDFSRVRIHDDAGSHARARTLRAEAYTLGSHVHFAAGRFRPGSREGLRLLAHELTHTIQQAGAVAWPAQGSREPIDREDSSLERAADEAAAAVLAGRPAGMLAGGARGGAQRAIQRQAAPAPADPDWHLKYPGCSPRENAQLDSLLDLARGMVLNAIGELESELEPSPSGIITRARSALLHNFHTEDPKDIKAIASRYRRILALLERGPRNVRCLPDPRCSAFCVERPAPFACAQPGVPITICSGVFDETTAAHPLFYSVVLIHEAAHQTGTRLHDYDPGAQKALPDPRRLALNSANVYANFAEDVSVGGQGSKNFFRR